MGLTATGVTSTICPAPRIPGDPGATSGHADRSRKRNGAKRRLRILRVCGPLHVRWACGLVSENLEAMAGLPLGLVVVAPSATKSCFAACAFAPADFDGLDVILGSNELAEAYLRQVRGFSTAGAMDFVKRR